MESVAEGYLLQTAIELALQLGAASLIWATHRHLHRSETILSIMKFTRPYKFVPLSACAFGLTALFSALPVLAQSGSMQNGSMQNGSMQNGSMQNGSMQDGSMQHGSMQDGSMQHGSMQQSSPSMGTPSMGNMRSSSLNAVDRQFIAKAAQSDMTEIMTSRLALERSQNPQVRQFAQQMIDQHTESSNKLKPIAAAKGVTLPTDVGPDNRSLLNQLNSLRGTQFDQAYMSGQLSAHSKTEAAYRQELRLGQDTDLKAFANQILPLVAEHRQMAQSIIAGR